VRWQTGTNTQEMHARLDAARPGLPSSLVQLGVALLLAMIAWSATWASTESKCKIAKLAELPITMDSLRPTISVKINGRDARFLLDSGAFYSMMSSAAASDYGLRLFPAPFGFYVQGVNGKTDVDIATVKEFVMAGVTFKNVEFLVGGSDVRDANVGLLGQNFLEKLDVEYDLASGVIRMFRTEKCENARLAYWLQTDQAYSRMPIDPIDPTNPRTVGVGYINGQKIRVEFDTGAFQSILSVKAAARAGVKLDSPGVVEAGYSGGVGRGTMKTYIAPFTSFQIGDNEEIKNARLRVADMDLQSADMLLGADFFVSHRIFVANREHRLFLSYNGGPVFNLTQQRPATARSTTDAPPAAQNDAADSAKDSAALPNADELARRGSALAARRDFPAALAALSKAIEQSPSDPEYYYQRANAYWANGQADLALADYDHVISLKQDFLPAYIPRAELKLAKKDTAAAIADLDAVDRLAPKQADLQYMLAEINQRIERIPVALEQFTSWIQYHSDDSRMPYALGGRCFCDALLNRDLASGKGDCETALRRTDKGDKEYPRLLVARGLVHLRQGDYAKALADFNASLAINPKNAGALYARAVAESRLHNVSESNADRDTAREHAPRVAEYFERFGIVP
jgi:tetratricopeptide (TPR) repeat protein